MKKLFSALLLFIYSYIFVTAQDSPASDFEYSTYQTTGIQIDFYKGQDSIIRVPAVIEGQSVTRINSLVSKENTIVKEIYIPASIKKLYKIIDNVHSSIKSIVIGRNDFETDTYLMYLSKSSDTFDNLIIFGRCTFDGKRLTSISDGVQKLSRIKVTVNGEEVLIQMYIYTKSKQGTVFENSRLDYLLSALVFQGYNLQDITKIDFSSITRDNGITFNLSNYNPANLLAPNAEIIIDTNTTIKPGVLTITDLTTFNSPRFESTSKISYSRTNTQDWNSVCLPFPIRESDFPEGTKIYTMTGGSEEKILLTRIGQDESLAAGTPCFINSVAETWDLNINATIPAQVKPDMVTQDGNSWVLKGCFSEIELGTGKYKLNSAGSEFVRTTENSHAWPFRCYLEPKNNGQGAPARLSVGVDEEASITLVPNDAEPQTVKLIDLMGRPRQGNAPGLYIRAKH